MTTTKKVLLGALISIVTLGGLISYAAPGHHYGKFGGMNGEKAEFMVSRISSKLDLNDEQKLNLVSLKDTILEQKQKHKGESPRDILKTLMAEPVLDESALLNIAEERTIAMNQAIPQVVTALATFTNSLSNEQRAEIVKLAEKFGKHRRGHFGKGHRKQIEESQSL